MPERIFASRSMPSSRKNYPAGYPRIWPKPLPLRGRRWSRGWLRRSGNIDPERLAVFFFAAQIQRTRCVQKELIALDDDFLERLPSVASGENNTMETSGVIFCEI